MIEYVPITKRDDRGEEEPAVRHQQSLQILIIRFRMISIRLPFGDNEPQGRVTGSSQRPQLDIVNHRWRRSPGHHHGVNSEYRKRQHRDEGGLSFSVIRSFQSATPQILQLNTQGSFLSGDLLFPTV